MFLKRAIVPDNLIQRKVHWSQFTASRTNTYLSYARMYKLPIYVYSKKTGMMQSYCISISLFAETIILVYEI